METEWYYQRHERETGVKKNYCTESTAEVEDDTKGIFFSKSDLISLLKNLLYNILLI